MQLLGGEVQRLISLHAPPLAWIGLANGLVVALTTLAVLSRHTSAAWSFYGVLVAAGAVLAMSLVAALLRPTPVLTLAEVFGLAVLVLLAVRRCRRAWAACAVAAVGAALGSAPPLRGPTFGAALGVDWVLLGLLVGFVVAVGLYLRSLDAARFQQVEQTRRDERLALAREMHDVVAHQVTGIIVQAQALRHVAERDPAAAVQALDQIERAGTDALSAMRRVVAKLRGDDEPAPRGAGELRAALEQLTTAHHSPPAHLTINNLDATAIPADVEAGVVRITQEGLTNAARHAAGATRVDVTVGTYPDQVTLAISDNGRGGPHNPGRGGHGLVGIAERVELLGGEFTAGPAHERGWTLGVTFPLDQEGSW